MKRQYKNEKDINITVPLMGELPKTMAGRLQMMVLLTQPTQEVDEYGEPVFNEDGSPSMIEPIINMHPEDAIRILDTP
jgi:hypothetical protein